ncbi:hypothetical protein T484DRAFT_1892946, partial [Baffinella frigidus]
MSAEYLAKVQALQARLQSELAIQERLRLGLASSTPSTPVRSSASGPSTPFTAEKRAGQRSPSQGDVVLPPSEIKRRGRRESITVEIAPPPARTS